eukprot:813506_1
MDVDSSSVCSSQSSSSQSAMSFESDLVAVKCHSCCSMVDVSKLDPIQLTQSQKKRHDAKKKAKNSPSVGSLKINSHHTSDADVFRFMVKQYCEGEKVKWSTVKEHCHVGYKRANLMVAEFLKNPKHYVETYGDGKVKCPSGDEVKIVETLQKKLEDLRKEHDALKVQKDECEEKMAIDLKQHSERVEQLQKQNSETVAKMETKVEAVHRQMSKMECDTSVQLKSKVESEVRSLRFVARQLEKENRDIHAQVWMVNTYDPYTNSELHRIQTEIRKLNSELEEVATNRDDLNKQLEFPAPNSQFEFAELHRKSSRQQVQLQQMAELCHKQQRQMAAMQRQTAAAGKLDQAAGGKGNQAAGGNGQAAGDNLNIPGDSGSMGARSDQDARQMLKSRKNIQLVQQGIHMAAQHSDGKIDRNSLAKAQNSFILAQNNQQIPPNNIQMIHNMVQNVTLSHLGQPNANFPQNHPNLMANTAQMTQRFAANSSRLPLRQEPGNLRQEPGNLHQARENLFNSNSYRPGQRLYGRSSGGAGLQSGPFPTRHPLMANGQPQSVNPAPRLPAYATRNGTSLENVIQMFQNLLGKDKLEIVAALTYVGHTSDFGSYVSRHVAKHSLFRIRTVFASPTDHSSLAHSTPRHWLNFARPIVRDVLMAVTTQILSSNPSIPQLFPSKPKTEGDSGVGQGSGASQGSGAGDQVSSVTANLSIDQSSSSNQTCANETTGVNHSSSPVSSSTQSPVVNHDPSTNSMPSAKQTSGVSQISGADQASNSNHSTSGASQVPDINRISSATREHPNVSNAFKSQDIRNYIPAHVSPVTDTSTISSDKSPPNDHNCSNPKSPQSNSMDTAQMSLTQSQSRDVNSPDRAACINRTENTSKSDAFINGRIVQDNDSISKSTHQSPELSSQLLKTSECDHVQSQPSSEHLSGHTNSAFSTVVQPTAENSSQNSKSPEMSQSKPIETSAIPNGTLSTEQSSGAGTSNSSADRESSGANKSEVTASQVPASQVSASQVPASQVSTAQQTRAGSSCSDPNPWQLRVTPILEQFSAKCLCVYSKVFLLRPKIDMIMENEQAWPSLMMRPD